MFSQNQLIPIFEFLDLKAQLRLQILCRLCYHKVVPMV